MANREWGYISPPDSRLPKWVMKIPPDEQLRFLASGPAFIFDGRDEALISTEKLIGQDTDCVETVDREEEAALRRPDENWYILLGEESFRNMLLTEYPSQKGAAGDPAWIKRFRAQAPGIVIYLVPRHPDQDST